MRQDHPRERAPVSCFLLAPANLRLSSSTWAQEGKGGGGLGGGCKYPLVFRRLTLEYHESHSRHSAGARRGGEMGRMSWFVFRLGVEIFMFVDFWTASVGAEKLQVAVKPLLV